MKKILLTTAALVLLGNASAYAQLDVNLSLGQPAPVYAAPAPVMLGQPPMVVAEPHHRVIRDDHAYWDESRARASWEHGHPGGRWDHNSWARDHRR